MLKESSDHPNGADILRRVRRRIRAHRFGLMVECLGKGENAKAWTVAKDLIKGEIRRPDVLVLTGDFFSMLGHVPSIILRVASERRDLQR
jgi:hypothetical protein